MEKEKKVNMKLVILIIDIICIVLVLGLVVGLAVHYWDEIKSLGTEEGREWLEAFIKKSGVWGILVIIAIQIIQVVVAFIPGEAVELVVEYYMDLFLVH